MITTRRPRQDEAAAFAALHVRCWQESYQSFLPAELMASFTVETRLQMWQAVLANDGRFVLGAYAGAAPVGFVISGQGDERLIDEQDGHIWSFYIAKAHHRHGIGRQLFQAALRDWQGRGGSSMTIGVLADNLPARHFYEAMGARLVKTSVYDWAGFALPDCIYLMKV